MMGWMSREMHIFDSGDDREIGFGTPSEASESDQFAPPAEPCECFCLHCRRTFSSTGIWFQRIVGGSTDGDGFWMCPTPNCEGAGFTFDIFPTDPDHPANLDWTDVDDSDSDDVQALCDEEEAIFEANADRETNATPDAIEEYDPDEPYYKMMDEEDEDEDQDIEGEEWKYGLQPGEKLPASRAMRFEYIDPEDARYDQPDTRPREIQANPSGDGAEFLVDEEGF